MRYFLGIDQGGTKTAAIVCDSNGNILGTGYDAGLTDVYFNDEEALYIKRLVKAGERACAMAGIGLEEVSAVCGGLSGVDWDFEVAIFTDMLSGAFNKKDVIAVNDCIIAMRGGSASRECAVVCAGSGLNVAVRGNGRETIYGYYIHTRYQGAGALGTAALEKIYDACMGICAETALSGLILGFTGYDNAESLLIDTSTGKYKIDSKLLAPLLLKAYAAGDKVAAGIIDEFCGGVARYIPAAMGKLGLSGRALDIVFSGSVFKDIGTLVADKIFEYIKAAAPGARKVHARYEPVCGAVLTLLDREWGNNQEFMKIFDDSAKSFGLIRNLDV